ncbi:MAG TPA: AAA family ATPase [Fimbriimonadaceae bacterium]|nr:AAA family ATPase [Fimbriimonadaceae bacterium]
MRIHVVGASGSGTTTLGAALGRRLGIEHLDTDAFYWLPTDPPFREKRPIPERVAMLLDEFGRREQWVLSGSLVSWGAPLVPYFTRVVFLSVPDSERMARLKRREEERYGDRMLPGGDMHESVQAFLSWARHYESGDFGGRSRRVHEEWLAILPCPVLRIEGTPTVDESVARVMQGESASADADSLAPSG